MASHQKFHRSQCRAPVISLPEASANQITLCFSLSFGSALFPSSHGSQFNLSISTQGLRSLDGTLLIPGALSDSQGSSALGSLGTGTLWPIYKEGEQEQGALFFRVLSPNQLCCKPTQAASTQSPWQNLSTAEQGPLSVWASRSPTSAPGPPTCSPTFCVDRSVSWTFAAFPATG